MRFRCILILWLIGICLTACIPGNEATSGMQVDSPISTLTSISPTGIPLPTEMATATSTVGAPTPMDTATPVPVLQLCSPLAEQTIQEIPEIVSDPYNPPRPGKDDRHHGTDFAYYRRKDRTKIEGEVVQALMAGRVVTVVQDQLPYGNMVIIETQRKKLSAEILDGFDISDDESLYILYAHFGSPPLVSLEDWVECGQAIGEVGASGYNIVNPHLHLETRIGPKEADFSDGMAYYDTRTTEAERTNYEIWRTSGEFRHFDPISLIEAYLQQVVGD